MKIKVANLRPNPFRNIATYPIDREKVENLKISMRKTGFWPTVMARPSKEEEGKYELAFGHHRHTALTELGYDEVDITVRDISDVHMIQMMADENFEYGQKDIRVVNETVASAKRYIENHIVEKNAVYVDLDDWCKSLWVSEEYFNRDVSTNRHISIGRSIIQKFLGDNWNRNTIATSLKILSGDQLEEVEYPDPDDDNDFPESKKETVKIPISREASEKFKEVGKSRAFVDTITRDEACRAVYPTKEAQEKVAEELIKEDPEMSSTRIKERLAEKAQEKIDNAMRLEAEHSFRKFLLDTDPTPSKSKILFKEIGRIKNRILNIPNFMKERVLTKDQVQAIINDLYEIEFLAQGHKRNMMEYFDLTPNKECISFDYTPTSFDFIGENPPMKIEVEMEDFEDDIGVWDDEDERWFTENIKQNREEDDND